MNYVNFMRKIEGKEPHDTSNSKTSGARQLDLLGIIEFARGLGHSSGNLEARQGVPDHRADTFWAGYDGSGYRYAMGLYGSSTTCFYWAGLRYQQQQGDTHRQQQDTVPVETSVGDGESSRPASGYYRGIWGTVHFDELFAMGRETSPPQSRPEPEGGVSGVFDHTDARRYYEQSLRSTISAEGSGVSSVCDEWESGERSAEDTWERNRRSLERSQRW
tara:strand:- start:8735 stop:9388 length:654 start_codon:yes stop_codon:yes gene_type:complete